MDTNDLLERKKFKFVIEKCNQYNKHESIDKCESDEEIDQFIDELTVI